MNLPADFLALARPSSIGCVRSAHWSDVEQRSGPLPPEYKAILSALGHGGYGCFIFFHPNVDLDYLNLYEAQIPNLEILNAWCPLALATIKTDKPQILGLGPERHLLVWIDDAYWLIDTELDRAHLLGSSVADWLVRQFKMAIKNLDGEEIGNSLWSTGSGMPDTFFRPYDRPG